MRLVFDVLFRFFFFFENQVVKDHYWFQEKPCATTLFFLFCRYVLFFSVCVLIPVKESRSILTHLFYIFYFFFVFVFLNAFFVSHHDCQILNWFSLIILKTICASLFQHLFFCFEFCDIRVVSSFFFSILSLSYFPALFFFLLCSFFFSYALALACALHLNTY